MSLSEFMSPESVWTIEDVSYFGNDRYGIQISRDNGGCDSIDYFMRTAKDGDVYYIGAVIDFHM